MPLLARLFLFLLCRSSLCPTRSVLGKELLLLRCLIGNCIPRSASLLCLYCRRWWCKEGEPSRHYGPYFLAFHHGLYGRSQKIGNYHQPIHLHPFVCGDDEPDFVLWHCRGSGVHEPILVEHRATSRNKASSLPCVRYALLSREYLPKNFINISGEGFSME